jgi:hypothetical protein
MVTSPTGVGGTAGAGILTPSGITHPGILEATGDLIGANGGLLGIAQSGLQGLSLANNISGLLGGASDAPVSGGTTASEWGGKFAKYKSPYKSLPMKRKKGINTQSIA